MCGVGVCPGSVDYLVFTVHFDIAVTTEAQQHQQQEQRRSIEIENKANLVLPT